MKTREEKILLLAEKILEKSLHKNALDMSCAYRVKNYCQCVIGTKKTEHFMILLLDNNLKLITSKILFVGTIDEVQIYTREIIKLALDHNAHSVIISHNHPSGNVQPSTADIRITLKIKSALKLIDMELIDHFIVSGNKFTSFSLEKLI